MHKDRSQAGSVPTPPQSRYGGGPGKGITLPPYYRPTPRVRNGTTFFGDEPRTVPPPERRMSDLVDGKTRGKAIPHERYVPPGVDRTRLREFPGKLVGRPAPITTSAPSAVADGALANGHPRYERRGGWYIRTGGDGPDRVLGKNNLPSGATIGR